MKKSIRELFMAKKLIPHSSKEKRFVKRNNIKKKNEKKRN